MHSDRRATSANNRRYEADKKAISAHGKRMSFGFGFARSESPIRAAGKHNAKQSGTGRRKKRCKVLIIPVEASPGAALV